MIFSMRRISTPSVCLQNGQMQHMDRGEQIIGGVARQLGSSGGRLLVKMVIATVLRKFNSQAPSNLENSRDLVTGQAR